LEGERSAKRLKMRWADQVRTGTTIAVQRLLQQ
jgi:hypothetical protein